MRIERIRTAGDFLMWLIDQIGHVLIVLFAVLPVLWWGVSGVPLAGVSVLSIREFEQWRDKSDLKKTQELFDPFFVRHIDRVLDVSIGSLVAWFLIV